MAATIARVEQWIAEAEVALTATRARTARLIPDMPDIAHSHDLQALQLRIIFLRQHRRRLLRDSEPT